MGRSSWRWKHEEGKNVGCIYKRGRIYWIKYSRAGRGYYESSGSRKHEDAKRLLRLREGDLERGVPVTPRVGRMRFEEAAEGIVTEYRTNGRKTLGHVERRIRLHLAPFFGGRRMATITTADFRRFMNQRQTAGASNAEINRELGVVKRMYSLAMHDGTLLARPHIPLLQEHNVRTGFFNREQIEAVLAHLPGPVQPVVRFAYLTGWRVPSEVLRLEWRQVDFTAGTVRLEVGTTKNQDGRVFPFDVLPELGDVLQGQRQMTSLLEQAQGRIVPWVFHRRGKQVKDFRDVWASACRAAGCPGRVPHDMRRSAVRNLVRAGVAEKTAMLLTGHKSRVVFDRYDIVNEDDLREAVRKLSAAGTAMTHAARS